MSSVAVSSNKNAKNDTKVPTLLADIGGTNARFALEFGSRKIDAISVLQCSSYTSLSHAMNAYLSSPVAIAAGSPQVQRAAIAIANPVDDDEIRMTNHHWRFSIEQVRREFQFESFLVVNDFKAMAMSIPYLSDVEKREVGGGVSTPSGVIGLLGPGTGLGVSALIPSREKRIALDSEGGHVTFSPSDEREYYILRYAWREYSHVSAERLLSGIGLDIVYRALAERAGKNAEEISVPEILRRAIAKECKICDETVECFCLMLGTFAGNLAITLGATGGVYIGGGIVPRLGERFVYSGFRQRFEEKGRFSSYLARIPTYLIAAEYPALLGLSAMLGEY